MNHSVPAIRTRVNAATISSQPSSPLCCPVQSLCVCVCASSRLSDVSCVAVVCSVGQREVPAGDYFSLGPWAMHFINLSTGKGLPLDRKSFTHTLKCPHSERGSKSRQTKEYRIRGIRSNVQEIQPNVFIQGIFLAKSVKMFSHKQQKQSLLITLVA